MLYKKKGLMLYCRAWEVRAGRLTLHREGINPPVLRKEGDKMVTYEALFCFVSMIIALVGLCYKIFRDKK